MDFQQSSQRYVSIIIITILLAISASCYSKNMDLKDSEILDDDDDDDDDADECRFNCDNSDTRNYILLGIILLFWVVAVVLLRCWCIRIGMFSGRGRRRRESRQNIVDDPVPPYQFPYPTGRSATEFNNNGQHSPSVIDLPPPSYPMQEYNRAVDINQPVVDSSFNNEYPLIEEPPPSYYEVASSPALPEMVSSPSHGESFQPS